MSRLLWRDAQGVEGSLNLEGREILIGRAMECAIRTEDAMVSRHHARVFESGGQYYVQDLGSSNGVYFQEQRVPQHALRHGDAIRCGSLWLRFVDTPPAQMPSGGGGPVPMHRSTSVPQRRTQASTEAPPPGFLPGAMPAAHGGAPAPAAAPAARPPGLSPSGGVPVAVANDRSGPVAPGDPEEVPRLRRRLEQMQAELRIYRGGGEGATRLEQVENELARVQEERDRFKDQVATLEAQRATEGGDAVVQRAGAIAHTASEIVGGLNDVLSNLRINVMAAEGEFEQYSNVVPRASFELIREALRSSANDMETARELLRKLRALAM